MKDKAKSFVAWGFAMAVGVAAGSMVAAARPTSLVFLPGSQEVGSSIVGISDDIKVRVDRYQSSEEATQVLSRIRHEYPIGHEETLVLIGASSWRFTVPRVRNGQPDLMYPPARELLVMEGQPTLVEVRDFQSPTLIDRFVEWTRHPFSGRPRRAS